MVESIYVGTINGRPVPFYGQDQPEGGVSLPWPDLPALLEASGISPDIARLYLEVTWSRSEGGVRKVTTPTGPAVVVSHHEAWQLLGVAGRLGHCTPAIDDLFIEAAAMAFRQVIAGTSVELLVDLAALRGRTG